MREKKRQQRIARVIESVTAAEERREVKLKKWEGALGGGGSIPFLAIGWFHKPQAYCL